MNTLTPTQKASYVHYHTGSNHDVSPETKGGFVLMGGSTDVDEAFQWMAERGGQGDFLVLRGSGSDGYQPYIDEITEANSVDTIVIKDSEAAHDPFVLDKVDKAEAIFFAGGDQWNYVGKWKNTPLLEKLNQAIERKVPMGGTSAGLAILGEHVFSAEVGTITSSEAMADPYDKNITIESDFLKAEPLKNLVTDTHFSERERLGRLITFMARAQQAQGTEEVRGIGVDEKTAVLVKPDGQARVVGQGAHFVKASSQPEKCEPGEPLTHRDLTIYNLTQDDQFDFNDWTSSSVEVGAVSVVKGKLSTP